MLVMMALTVAASTAADGNGGGVILTDDAGAMQINSSDALAQPVLLNGKDVLSTIREQAHTHARISEISSLGTCSSPTIFGQRLLTLVR